MSAGAGRSVLLVEDAAELRLLLRMVLEADGFVVNEAADGAAGLQAARDLPPDVVLLDVQLPVLDGPRVLELLQQDPATSDVAVVFLTAEPAATHGDLLARGARAVLPKPFDATAVAADLAALL